MNTMETKDTIDIEQTIVGNLMTFFYWIVILIVLIGGFILVQRLEDEVNYILGLLIITISTLRLIDRCHFKIYLK